MKKINLTQDQENALAQHSQSGAKGVEILKSIFEFYINDLVNIENVDAKGNMGLQTLARQHALETIKEVRDLVFPELAENVNKKPAPGGQSISQYR